MSAVLPMFLHTDPSTWLSASRKLPLKAIISPSILASDFACLRDECESILSGVKDKADWLHLDIMDGHFVPNISFGSCVVESLRKHLPKAFFDCHLMVSEPEKWVKIFSEAGASQFTFHCECETDLFELAKSIRSFNMQVGVSIKPSTPIEKVTPLIDRDLIDMVLIMTVEPGFGGQSFMPNMLCKVEALRSRYRWLNIQVDGGIGLSNIKAAAEAGANVFVAGTSIFKAPDRQDVINQFRQIITTQLEK